MNYLLLSFFHIKGITTVPITTIHGMAVDYLFFTLY